MESRGPPKCPFTEEWIETVWYSHTVDYYAALNKKAMWVDLEAIELSEISQAQKDKPRRTSLLGGTRNSQTHRSRKRKGDCRAERGEPGPPASRGG